MLALSHQPLSLFKKIAIGFAAYALIGGLITLIGWYARLPFLTDWISSGISMFPNAALGALCSGTALILLVLQKQRLCLVLGRILGIFVLLLGGCTLLQHVAGVNLGIDTMLLTPPWGSKAAMAPGRMGPPASTSYALIGTAFILMSTRSRFQKFAPIFGIMVCAITVLSLMGYAFGADPLFAVARFTGIAMQTATILLALALGLLCSLPDCEPLRTLRQNSAAGLLGRRSLPFIVVEAPQ
jgi:hypothetical protein